MASKLNTGKAVVSAKSAKAAAIVARPKSTAAAKVKQPAAAKAKRAKVPQQNVTIRLSLAETVHLPYRPTSFKISDMRRVIADVKRAQG